MELGEEKRREQRKEDIVSPAGDGDIDELGWRVHISEGHNRDVSIATLSDGLMVSPGVSDQKQPWLTESCLDLISKCSRSEATSYGIAANISSELEDSSLSGGPCGHHVHILWVLNSSDSTGSENQLLPGLLEINNVDTAGLLLEDVLLHGSLAVVGANVGGGSQHLSDVILGNGEAIKAR